MNKKALLKALQDQLECDLLVLKQAALNTYSDATHEENKPENKYDTRALEASYLAGAQAERVQEVGEMIGICKIMNAKQFTNEDAIGLGALIEVECQNKRSFLFYFPKGGGATFEFENKKIQVITPTSPLGQKFMGLTVGDEVSLEKGPQARTYEIIALI